MENGVRILHRRKCRPGQISREQTASAGWGSDLPTDLLYSHYSAYVWLSWVSFEPSFVAVRIQHSLICQTVLSYSSADPSRVPHECFKVSKPHRQLLNSARCLQSEAVSKGCVEFVEAAEQRKRDRSCLRCTSAAVMFPPWTQQEELEHMGADSVSQPAGSLHKTAQICCFLLQEFPLFSS